MANDTIKYILPYWGNFLYHYAPMELSLKPCNYGCKYCFAHANGYKNDITTEKIVNWISSTYTKDTYLGYLMREGYPVVVSNRSDPFCKDNALMMPILNDLFNDLNIPIAWQTKGGESIFKMLDNVRPSHWYITLTTLDDKIRKQFEPNAPPIQHRLELIQELVRRGHMVEVAPNPFIPEWVNTFEYIEKMKELGIGSTCAIPFHLNKNQQRMVTPLALDLLKRTYDGSMGDFIDHITTFKEVSLSAGIEVHDISKPEPETFFMEYQRYYPKTFLTITEASTIIQGMHEEGVYFDFDTFWGWFKHRLPDIRYSVSAYIALMYHKYDYHTILKNGVYGFEELMRHIWNNPKDPEGLRMNHAFAPMYDTANGELNYYGKRLSRCSKGNLIYACAKYKKEV